MAQAKKALIKRTATKTTTKKKNVIRQAGKTIKVDIASLKPIDAPYFSAGSIAVQGTGNDILLTFSRPMPAQAFAPGGVHQSVVINQAIVVISVSPQTAKDIVLAIASTVTKHEMEYGEVTTPYIKRQMASVRHKKGR